MEEPLGFVYVFVHVTLARLLNIDTSDKKKQLQYDYKGKFEIYVKHCKNNQAF